MNGAIDRIQTSPRMSKIVQYAGLVFLSGQTSGGTEIFDINGQTREVLRRIDTLLAKTGSDRSRLLSATIYLRDMADFDSMNAEWEAWIPATATPARATVEARLADPRLLVEISLVAAARLEGSPA